MFWRSVSIALEIALRFLLLVALLAAARHAVFPHETPGALNDINSPIGPLSIDPTDERPAAIIFLRNVSVMLFFAALVSLDMVRRGNRKLNPRIGARRDRIWKYAVHTLFWLFTIWMILRLTSAYIDLAAASQLPIWKLFVSTLPYGALGITGIAMPLACWLVTPSRSFDHLFRSTMARSLEFGALLIAAAAAIESIYRPDLIHLWFHI